VSYPDSAPDNGESPEGVTFLTALLIRFKEIGSARLSRTERLLAMDFYVLRDLPHSEFEELEERLRLHLDALSWLQRAHPRLTRLKHGHGRLKTRGFPDLRDLLVHPEDEDSLEVQSVTLERDLESLSTEEISLVVSVVSEHFVRDLATNEDVPSDESGQAGENFYRSLERVRNAHYETDLTGFRDDMRVLIYSSAEVPPSAESEAPP
jgi:hypothetical protein